MHYGQHQRGVALDGINETVWKPVKLATPNLVIQRMPSARMSDNPEPRRFSLRGKTSPSPGDFAS
jgi:hypothetical protein